MKTEPVLIRQYSTRDDRSICEITLNNESSLHALNLTMLQMIDDVLDQCQQDPQVAAVLITSTGERAFSAGGDVVAAYHAIQGGEFDRIETYFETEYQLDYRIRASDLPIIAWGDGLILGGGLGIFHACQQRIVTSRSKLAMPEASIGLYPDVGASWFLNRLPSGIGLYLAMTGHMVNSVDARLLGFADWQFPRNSYQQLVNALQYAEWSDDNHAVVSRVLYELTRDLPECDDTAPQLAESQLWLSKLMLSGDLKDVYHRLLDAQLSEAWFETDQRNLSVASPLALALINRQLERTKLWSLTHCLRSELSLSVQCSRDGDFAEGVRALLVDKDKSPRWRYDSLDRVDPSHVEKLLEPLWPDASMG